MQLSEWKKIFAKEATDKGLISKIYKQLMTLRAFLEAQMVKSLPAVQEPRVHSLGREDPLEKEMKTLCSTLAGEFYGQRSLAGYSQ